MKQTIFAESVSARAVTYILHKLNYEKKESYYIFYCHNEQVRKDSVAIPFNDYKTYIVSYHK